MRVVTPRVARAGGPFLKHGGRAVAEDSAVFVGIDAAKLKHAVAIAELRRTGEVRYIGEIEASVEAVRKLLTKLAM